MPALFRKGVRNPEKVVEMAKARSAIRLKLR